MARSRLCLLAAAFGVILQLVILLSCLHSIHVNDTAAAASLASSFSTSTVLTNSQQQFLSYGYTYPSTNKENMNVSMLDHVDLDRVAETVSTRSPRESIELQDNATITADQTNALNNIPEWLKEYTQWHYEQRKDLSPDNWNVGRKYLVVQCLEMDKQCGGTADRLKPIPTLLYLAHQYKRILLIRWERPCKLEEFLQPTIATATTGRKGGLDWRVPDWLASKLGARPTGGSIAKLHYRMNANGGNDTVVRSRYQSFNGGADYYNEQQNATAAATSSLATQHFDSFQEVYHSVWHAMFQPSPPVQQQIDNVMHNLSLTPGEYAAAHLRAVYGVQSRPRRVIRQWAINAVNCASQLRPGGPIYFAADSKYAIEVVQRYAKDENKPIVSLVHEKDPLHLEKSNHTGRHPSEYYDTFVDLYLLGHSQCLSYNVGGFGTWGLLIGYNATCGYQHAPRHFSKFNKCDWTDAAPS